MNQHNPFSRRSLLTTAACAAAGLALARPSTASAQAKTVTHDKPFKGLKVGVATYTFIRFELADAIKGVQKTGLAYCSIKDKHLPFNSTPEQAKETVAKFKAAGITPLSVGNITIPNNEAKIREIFQYVKNVGVPVMVCAPVKEALPLCEKYVKEFDVRMAIHNHGPEDKNFPSPYDVMKAAEQMDHRIGCCIDVGHTARAEVDPAEAIEKIGARVYDIHMKDLARIDRRSIAIEVGRGVLDVKGMLAALLKINFQGHVGFEHEKDMNEPLPGLCESAGYVRGLTAAM